jgi:hypothetical protein
MMKVGRRLSIGFCLMNSPIEELECLAQRELNVNQLIGVYSNKYGAFHSVALIGNKLALIDDLGELL